MTPKVLFILKENDMYGTHNHSLSSGLLNSAHFIVTMLTDCGIETKLVQVVDNNNIDRQVTLYRPTHVIIEALWVVPEKFEILRKLHPGVLWIIRIHSELPFLANEGMALNWITRYVKQPDVYVATNSTQARKDCLSILQATYPEWGASKILSKVWLLPNYYPEVNGCVTKDYHNRNLEVACFGAIRPLKNQLIQAVAAISYAAKIKKHLRFHINVARPEQGGDNNLKNIRALFAVTPHAELVEYGWLDHHEFLQALRRCDISLCVSFSETFCIVAADSIYCGVPVVGSKAIPWLSYWSQASTTDSADIEDKMGSALGYWGNFIKCSNKRKLKDYCAESKRNWLAYL